MQFFIARIHVYLTFDIHGILSIAKIAIISAFNETFKDQ